LTTIKSFLIGLESAVSFT